MVPDNDAAGRDKGEAAVAALYGVAASVRFCTVCADLGARADVSDWLEASGLDGAGVMAALEDDPNDLLGVVGPGERGQQAGTGAHPRPDGLALRPVGAGRLDRAANPAGRPGL